MRVQGLELGLEVPTYSKCSGRWEVQVVWAVQEVPVQEERERILSA